MARLGCLALATIHPVEYAQLLEGCGDDTELAARERERLQADHNDVTVSILEDCGIPGALAEAVFHHEAPENAHFTDGSRPHQLVHLFYHAKRVADMGLAPEARRSGIIAGVSADGALRGGSLASAGPSARRGSLRSGRSRCGVVGEEQATAVTAAKIAASVAWRVRL
jgi:hypothetical protein